MFYSFGNSIWIYMLSSKYNFRQHILFIFLF